MLRQVSVFMTSDCVFKIYFIIPLQFSLVSSLVSTRVSSGFQFQVPTASILNCSFQPHLELELEPEQGSKS